MARQEPLVLIDGSGMPGMDESGNSRVRAGHADASVLRIVRCSREAYLGAGYSSRRVSRCRGR